ncbi:TorA maturation chaperone TorD [Nonomuraea polychroma]|uniref:TorA maturation chaperone TorD n=1 Tax=Nonomuraea polychroma TaxID=46176 RepID=A0A438M2T5_9ACTN|nr:molecular chaperone TorD family protein [Nonomuraea polychroma]RVX39798.1 TorA maturation chaperone TorD [Nonomuraea polychroma]
MRNELSARRNLYELASRILSREIDPPLYRALQTAETELTDESSGAMLISPHLEQGGEEHALEALCVEFCRLFIGPHALCPPYESIQRGEAMLGGRAERAFTHFLYRHGLQPAVPQDLPILATDHLSVQLAVLSHLHDRTLRSGSTPETRHIVEELLNEHVLPWAPAYLDTIRSATDLNPYQLIAEVTAQFLRTEQSLELCTS